MSRPTSILRYLGLAAGPRPVARAATPSPAAARPARPTRQPHPLRWLGLAEQPIRLEGHPRIRERAIAALTRRRRRDRAITAGIGTLLAVALLAYGVIRSPLLAVDDVTVIGLDDAQGQAVAQAVAVIPGTNVMDVDLEVVAADAERLPWVSTATVVRRLPSTVQIRVATRTAVAVAVLDGRSWLLDAEGGVMEEVTGPDVVATTRPVGELPEVAVLQEPVVGRPVAEPSVRAAAAVAAGMPRALEEWIIGYAATGGGEVDARLRLSTDEGPAELVARLGRPEAIAAKAATLAALLEETVGRGMRPSVLDVRIPDRPVVRP